MAISRSIVRLKAHIPDTMTSNYAPFGPSKRTKALLEQMLKGRQQELEHFQLMITYIKDDHEDLDQRLVDIEKDLNEMQARINRVEADLDDQGSANELCGMLVGIFEERAMVMDLRLTDLRGTRTQATEASSIHSVMKKDVKQSALSIRSEDVEEAPHHLSDSILPGDMRSSSEYTPVPNPSTSSPSHFATKWWSVIVEFGRMAAKTHAITY